MYQPTEDGCILSGNVVVSEDVAHPADDVGKIFDMRWRDLEQQTSGGGSPKWGAYVIQLKFVRGLNGPSG